MPDGYRFEDVRYEPDGVPVLRGITVTLPAEGITVLAGPSGSGKSTILRMCNRLEVPTGGAVRLDGIDLAALDPLELRRRAGMVFQQPVRFGGTAADNLRVADPAATDGELEAVLRRVHLDPAVLGRAAADLSGGEAQRMCIARTLLTRPDILLMDEATSALDVDSRAAIEHLVRELADDGTAVVWVTHDLDQAARMAARTVVVVDGMVVADDDAHRFLEERSFHDHD